MPTTKVCIHPDTTSTSNQYKYSPRTPYQVGIRRYQSSSGLLSQSYHLSALLHAIPFQFFLTVRPVTDNNLSLLKASIANFIQACERHHRAILTYAVGWEVSPEVNCHLCLACSVRLDESWIKAFLNHFNIKLEPFDPGRDALPYTLKAADTSDGDWEIVNAEVWLKTPTNHQERRRLKRQQERSVIESSK